MFVDASTVAVAAAAYLKTISSLATEVEIGFLIGKCKVASIEKISIPKLELEAAVIGVRRLSTIMKESFNNHRFSLFALHSGQMVK